MFSRPGKRGTHEVFTGVEGDVQAQSVGHHALVHLVATTSSVRTAPAIDVTGLRDAGGLSRTTALVGAVGSTFTLGEGIRPGALNR